MAGAYSAGKHGGRRNKGRTARMRGAGREARKKTVGNSDVIQEQLTIYLWVLNILFFGRQESVKRVGTDKIGQLCQKTRSDN